MIERGMPIARITSDKELLKTIAKQHNLQVHGVFATSLQRIWRGGDKSPRIGLAISGGVDSMALARLCHDVVKGDTGVMKPLYAIRNFERPFTAFTAFIVNHELRENSRAEAESVAAELAKLDIESEILNLDWGAYGDPKSLTNVESIARKLRYRALGTACANRRINSLLLAHHSDDRAETVLARIVDGYVGLGLRGIPASAPMPECTGIYGVDHSGGRRTAWATSIHESDAILIESGGVYVARPLLTLQKSQLVNFCLRHGMKWFEDPTNHDVKYTLRNTIRALLANNVLPVALQSPRLSTISQRIGKQRGESEHMAKRTIDTTPIELNLKLGEAKIILIQTSISPIQSIPRLENIFLRQCLELVSPKATISTQHLDAAVDYIFPPGPLDSDVEGTAETKAVQVAGVSILRQADTGSHDAASSTFTLQRALPSKLERQELQLVLWSSPMNYSARGISWQLWDGRYWIRVSPPKTLFDHDTKILARFLDPNDLASLRKNITRGERERLDNALASAKGLARFTLPAIVIERNSSSTPPDGESPTQNVVALPSLHWSVDGWARDGKMHSQDTWRWDIRYKHVDLRNKSLHKIVG